MSDHRYAFAQDVARRAGVLALDYWRDRERLTVELKGPQDFVSRADRDVEALIRGEIAAKRRKIRLSSTVGDYDDALS